MTQHHTVRPSQSMTQHRDSRTLHKHTVQGQQHSELGQYHTKLGQHQKAHCKQYAASPLLRYKGLGVNMLRTVPACVLTFLVYESLLQACRDLPTEDEDE